MIMTAVLSEEQPEPLFRPELRRIWDKTKRLLVVCMLNPSTADHRKNDPTIVTLIGFAKLWGYGGLIVVNLFDRRTSSPKEMMKCADPISGKCLQYIDQALTFARSQGTPVLVAWGRDGGHLDRDAWFRGRAAHHLVDLVCLGKTKEGFPKHPMARGVHRIPRDQQPIMFQRAIEVAR
jgi:hypothetical protein